MKRSQYIDLDFMRKIKRKKYFFSPLAISVAAISVSGCSSPEQIKVVTSVEDCMSTTSLSLQECEAAYQRAIAEAERTGPKYSSQRSCEAEFGYEGCHRTSSGFFSPLIAGFIIREIIDEVGDAATARMRYGRNPVYKYNRPYSKHHDQIMTTDGTIIGKAGKSNYKVPKSTLSKRKPTVTKTVSRGGFGSVASAKSSWGGGKSRGWGG